MKTVVKTGALLLSSLLLGACSRSHTYKLPDALDGDLAFAVLYDGAGRAVAVGDVITRQALKAGGYALEVDGSDLTARLFFVKNTDVADAALAACVDLPTRAQARACADLVASCGTEANPVACLAVHLAGDTCGPRLTLRRPPAFSAYESDAADVLRPVADPSPLTAALLVCGPVVEPGCPNLLPGYTVTEGGSFRCMAPLRQLGCSAEIDLSACGLGTAKGTIDATGAFTGALDGATCAPGPVAPGDTPLDPAAAGAFAVSCGPEATGRRFVASPMEVLFGEPACPERGPRIFEAFAGRETFASEVGAAMPGRIAGLLSLRPSGWRQRLVFAGSGVDLCTLDGCRYRGDACLCGVDCDALVEIPECADASPTASCAPATSHDACLARCTAACQGGDDCAATASGLALAVVAPEDVEKTVAITDLDLPGPFEATPTRPYGLALLGERSAPWIAVATRHTVRLFSTAAADRPAEVAAARFTPAVDGLELAGVAAAPGRTDQLVAFGRAGGRGQIVLVDLGGDPTAPTLSAHGAPLVSALPGIDELTFGGPNDGWIFGAAVDAPIGQATNQVELFSLDASAVPGPITLAGPVRALAALPGGAVAAAIMPPGGPGRIVLLTPSGDGASVAQAEVLVPGGLVPAAIFPDPTSCATEDRCRVYLGLEQVNTNDRGGRALVGLLEYDRVAPGSSRVVPTFVPTGAEEISFFTQDAVSSTLFAVAATRDRVSRIQLVK